MNLFNTSISNCDVEKALCGCSPFENVFHCFIEDFHSSEASALQAGFGKTIHSLTLCACMKIIKTEL